MTTPMKPWENVGSNLRSGASPLSIQSSSKLPEVNVRTMSTAPPPLPPRPSNVATRRLPSYSGIIGGSTLYRGYASNNGYVGGYGGYGGYGTYGSGYGGYGTTYSGYPYGYQQTNDNRLVALAEERTRPAFESIESVVRAFGSVSFMLESTLGALHASFRAALGVADHLSHLRNILSALSLFRLLQWCLRQLRRLFGVQQQEAGFGGVWGEAAKLGEQVGAPEGVSSGSPSQWPLRAFIGIVISGSYLAWKLLSYIVGPGDPESISPFKGEESELWVQGKDSGCQLAVGCYNFTATLDQELSFSVGDRLIIAPKARQPADCRDWVLAAHLSSARHLQQSPPRPVKVGLVPVNYVRVMERRPRQAVYQPAGAAVPAPMVVSMPAQGLPGPTVSPGTVVYIQPDLPPPAAVPHCNPTGIAPNPPIVVHSLHEGPLNTLGPCPTATPPLAATMGSSSNSPEGSDSKAADRG